VGHVRPLPGRCAWWCSNPVRAGSASGWIAWTRWPRARSASP
jgi:hypothetical protein